MTKEQLEKRMGELRLQIQAAAQQREAHVNKANELQAGIVAAQGAMADCEYWLSELAKAEEPKPEAPTETPKP